MQPAATFPNQLTSVAQSSAQPAVAIGGRGDRWGFLELFVIAQVVLPALLFFPGTQALRIPIRIAPFALSVCGFWFLISARRRPPIHPACIALILVVVYLATMIAAPNTNTIIAGAGQTFMYAAVMAPLFWAPTLVRDKNQLIRVLKIIMICDGVNAAVGVLQVKYPDRFMPAEFSSVMIESGGLEGATYVGPDGQKIMRPPGLSDSPGAVCGPAAVAGLLGLAIAIRRGGFVIRLAGVAASFAGVAAIFLTHVRSSILVLVGTYIIFCLMLLIQKQEKRAITFASIAGGIFIAGFTLASILGGEAITERFSTLFEDDAITVYQRNRGFMMMDTVYYISEYPLGAGLGRWGMMRVYFGNENNLKSPPLWAEMQFPAWALDGGIIVLGLYGFALLRDLHLQINSAFSLQGTAIATEVAAIVACNAGILALLFSYTPFNSQSGVQYWFTAGLVFGARHLSKRALT